MEQNKVDPNVVTYTSLLNAHSKALQPMAALEVLRKMQKAGVTPTAVIYSTLISVLAQRRLVE
eukprot:471304-Amphidinium_carterae.2